MVKSAGKRRFSLKREVKSNGNIATTLLLRHPAGRRCPDGGIRQHALPQDDGLQVAQRETEHRLHRRRRQSGERHPGVRPDGEHRGAVRRGRQVGRATFTRHSTSRRSTQTSARCWTRKPTTSTPSSSPSPTSCTPPRPSCMERGKHVYVQKPLARTIWEARMLTEAAAKYKVATQMGNQGYSNEGTRQCAEMIWAGEIGNVTEVHAWTNRPIWPQGLTEIPARDPGSGDAGLGPLAGHRQRAAVHFGRRGLPRRLRAREFLPAVQLARLLRFRLRRAGRHGVPHSGRAQHGAEAGKRAPTSVECVKQGRHQRLHVPQEVDHPVRFPGARIMPPVKMFWYDAMKEQPEIPGVPEGRISGRPAVARAVRRRQGQAPGPRTGWPRQGGRGTGRSADAAHRGHRARLHLGDQHEALKEIRRPPARPEWQPVHRRQGHHHHRHLWRGDAPHPGGEDEGLQVPAAEC